VHLVGCFHSCITTHGFMNVKNIYSPLLECHIKISFLQRMLNSLVGIWLGSGTCCPIFKPFKTLVPLIRLQGITSQMTTTLTL